LKIAITGSNGFVGNACCNYLIDKSFEIKKLQRIRETGAFYVDSFSPKTNWSEALNDVDVIIHCAALVHEVKIKKQNLKKYNKFNAISTYNLAMQAAKNNVKKFIFLSSIKVNGDYTKKNEAFVDPFLCNPKGCYSISKLNAEIYLREISLTSNLQTIIIRPPLIYGEGVKANFLNLIHLIERRIPLPLASINNLRSFLYIDNLCDFIYQIIKSKSEFRSKTFLLSDYESISTTELINQIAKGLNVKSNLFKIPQEMLYLSSKLLGKEEKLSKLICSLAIDSRPSYQFLNWYPPFSINEGIQKTAQWYKSKKNNS